MPNAVVPIFIFIFLFMGAQQAHCDGINDDDIKNYGLQLLNQGYSAMDIIEAKAKFVNEHTADIPQRIKRVHVGTTYQELMNIWSGWKAKSDIEEIVDGTVLRVDYQIPTTTDNLKEVPVHIIYTVANSAVKKIDFSKDQEKLL